MLVDVVFLLFFFFKQKTAYEMRISDWSSDVCSSDLGQIEPRFRHHLCRGTAPLCGVALRLCAPAPRNDAEARRRAYRRPVAGDQHRAEDDEPQPALDRRDGDRDLRLYADRKSTRLNSSH